MTKINDFHTTTTDGLIAAPGSTPQRRPSRSHSFAMAAQRRPLR